MLPSLWEKRRTAAIPRCCVYCSMSMKGNSKVRNRGLLALREITQFLAKATRSLLITRSYNVGERRVWATG